MKKCLRLSSLLLLSILLILPSYGFAGSEATITLEPRNPTPNTPITATLVSYLFDVNTALITWSIDGKVLKRGLGEKRIIVETGEVGSIVPLHATAVTANNDRYEVDITITPESVAILYETPESYVPLFYEGRSLPGEGALVNFVAMPTISENGDIIAPSSLSYSWYVSGDFIDNASGIGKQSALLELDFLRSFTTVKVIVRGPRGTVAEKSIDVYPHDVMPLLYTHDDILGTNFTSVISRRFEATKDFTLSLEPFFFSTNKSLQDTATYTWLLDGLPVTPLGGTLLSMHPKENSYGSKKLSITLENSKRRLQKITTTVELIFDTR